MILPTFEDAFYTLPRCTALLRLDVTGFSSWRVGHSHCNLEKQPILLSSTYAKPFTLLPCHSALQHLDCDPILENLTAEVYGFFICTLRISAWRRSLQTLQEGLGCGVSGHLALLRDTAFIPDSVKGTFPSSCLPSSS